MLSTLTNSLQCNNVCRSGGYNVRFKDSNLVPHLSRRKKIIVVDHAKYGQRLAKILGLSQQMGEENDYGLRREINSLDTQTLILYFLAEEHIFI